MISNFHSKPESKFEARKLIFEDRILVRAQLQLSKIRIKLHFIYTFLKIGLLFGWQVF